MVDVENEVGVRHKEGVVEGGDKVGELVVVGVADRGVLPPLFLQRHRS